MAKYHYTTYHFEEPNQLDVSDYYMLKELITRNPNYEIVRPVETFFQHFKENIKIAIYFFLGGIAVGFVLWIISLIFNSDGLEEAASAIGPLGILGFFLLLFQFAMEGPSFMKYKRRRSKFFNKMKAAIQQTNTYDDFAVLFYRNRRKIKLKP